MWLSVFPVSHTTLLECKSNLMSSEGLDLYILFWVFCCSNHFWVFPAFFLPWGLYCHCRQSVDWCYKCM